MKPTYAEQLKDPRWQKKRLEVLEHHEFMCMECGDTKSTLHVHHRYYVSGRLAWEYPDFCYQTLCEGCHDSVWKHTKERRENGECMFEDWEFGLNKFGDYIFDMAANGTPFPFR